MKYLEDIDLNKLNADLTNVPLNGSRVIHGRLEAYSMKRVGDDKKYAQALGEKYVAEIETMENQLEELIRKKSGGKSINHHINLEGEEKNDYDGDKNKEEITREEVLSSASTRKRSQSVGTESDIFGTIKQSKYRRTRASSFDERLGRKNNKHIGLFPSRTESALGNFCETSTRRLMIDLILMLNSSFPDYEFSGIRPGDFVKITTASAMLRINQKFTKATSTSSNCILKPNFLVDLWTTIDSVIKLSQCGGVYSYVPQSSANAVIAGDADDDPLGFVLQNSLAPTEQDNGFENDVESNDDLRIPDTPVSALNLSRTVSGTTKPSIACRNSSNINHNTSLWSFNYFFVNKSSKRILFFTCIESMRNGLQEMNRSDVVYKEESKLTCAELHNRYNEDGKVVDEVDDNDELLENLDYKFLNYNSDDNFFHDDYDLDPAVSDVAGGIPIAIEGYS